MAHFVHSHIAHFYALAAPDFVMGPKSDPASRNIVGIIGKLGVGIGTEVIRQRRLAQEIQALLGGHQTHVVMNVPGGVRRGLSEEERKDIVERAKGFIGFAQFSLKLFDDVVLANDEYRDIILNGPYTLNLHSMGLVDKDNKVNFYDGKVRVVDTEGNELYKYDPVDYREYVSERVEPWSYLKFPYLKKKGWKGFVDGPESGVYHATPLSRLNASDGMATPLAQTEHDRMYATLGGKPVHATLAMHWARLIELLYSAERLLELATDPDITSKDICAKIDRKKIVGEGVGTVEAQRGTLTHHYWTDKDGMVRKVNLIVGTTNNNAAICMSLKKAAQALIHHGLEEDQGILNMVEMGFRAYDPCFSCATHHLPGRMPLQISFVGPDGRLIREVRRDP
jgi:F420-non-reducing hydrogenase large subunit